MAKRIAGELIFDLQQISEQIDSGVRAGRRTEGRELGRERIIRRLLNMCGDASTPAAIEEATWRREAELDRRENKRLRKGEAR